MKKFGFIIFLFAFVGTLKAQKIFAVDYASQADVKVFVVKYESQAGWRNSAKRYLFY